MDNSTSVYVLVTLGLGRSGEVVRRNVGVTFNIHEAEAHSAADVSNEYDTFQIAQNWRDGAGISEVVLLMREQVGIIQQDIERSLA